MRDHDRHHRRLSRRDRGRLRSDARDTFGAGSSQTPSRSSIRSGAGRRPRAGNRCRATSPHARFARLVEAQNGVTRAYHERKIGRRRARFDRRRLEKRCEPAHRQDARQRDDRRAEAARLSDRRRDAQSYARTPWLDVAIESAHVWGCAGTIVARADDSRRPGVPFNGR